MNRTDRSKKVIQFPGRERSSKRPPGERRAQERTNGIRTIAVSSGKGGVGKTNVVANLAFVMTRLGKRVLVVDADLGLGNLDVLLGITPEYNLSHVISGEKEMLEIAVSGPGDMVILPAASGIPELTELSEDTRQRVFGKLDRLLASFDVLLIDTAAGISSNVMHFSAAAEEVMVVVSPEPTSITDAYALMKVLSLDYAASTFKLLVNLARSRSEALEIFRHLETVTDRFLDVSVESVGYVLFDEKVSSGVRLQRIVCQAYPETRASRCFASVGRKLCAAPRQQSSARRDSFSWRELLGSPTEKPVP